jgi:hypothetical protein
MTLSDVGKETVNALKGSPMLLVIILLNVFMLFMIGTAIKQAQDNNHAIIKLAIEKCGK